MVASKKGKGKLKAKPIKAKLKPASKKPAPSKKEKISLGVKKVQVVKKPSEEVVMKRIKPTILKINKKPKTEAFGGKTVNLAVLEKALGELKAKEVSPTLINSLVWAIVRESE